MDEEYNIINREIFDGKNFGEEKNSYEIVSRHVATTASGVGYGILKNNETVIPFEYDRIYASGNYFVAVKYNNGDFEEQVIDIYDSKFNKTAANLNYIYFNRDNPYGTNCALPDGYFDVSLYKDEEYLHGIIDYNGNIILEPVFYRGIRVYSYESTGKFSTLY